MSIFKTIGNKLKRVVSLKNAISAVTGNYGAVVADAKRVMSTPDSKRKNPASQVVLPVTELPKEIDQLINNQANLYQDNLAKSIGKSKLVQDNINGTNALFSKIWFQATWEKNKKYLIWVLMAVALFIGWKLYKKSSTSIRGRRR
ncbi:hypothetical protein [Flavobacterium franklandianum]|uniref:Uncharacterized protein n=1 Tax=Flavobacterium franklandianum TaxID=2594430 RepID=A0A553C8A4_9FLAO|nr:hypothetical protein [Flavobacterium franklandianum]TRX16735.1 hypothetical protein FNW17_12290 [Flavobacterium franklandianum]